MSVRSNTLYLRLEGPLQAWGDTSKFVIRRSMEAPTKSGVLGLVCCALGLSRQAARKELAELSKLLMGVRIDRPGTRWWDFHTVGAGIGILNARGKVKRTASTGAYETLITRREYLTDASFLVALQGSPDLIENIAGALGSPKWPLYLGRKSCPPSAPIFNPQRQVDAPENPTNVDGGLKAALERVPWRPRYKGDSPEDSKITLPCLVEWRKRNHGDIAPANAEVWYDVPFSFDPPVHYPRLVIRDSVAVKVGEPLQRCMPSLARPRADYGNAEYKKRRNERLRTDRGLCVFCKQVATTVQHVSYRHAGGDERLEELRSLCRLCHDAVTMIEYGLGMGLDRINPEELRWRDRIIEKRDEIVRFRSLETRRRRLASEDVE